MKPADLEKLINKMMEMLYGMIPLSVGFRMDFKPMVLAQLCTAKEVIFLRTHYVRHVWYSVDVWLIASLIDEQGNDRVVRIYKPGQIFTDAISFFKAIPSRLEFRAFTKGVLLSIRRSAVMELKKHPETHELVTSTLLLEQETEAWRVRVMAMHDKDKVEAFAAEYPINKVPNKYAASFLNMVPANYSREKAAYNTKNKD
ncbi:cyclic nucleotide-binding domain-containing protein [Mucilaginibacter lappiensis]|uniref:cAMP-binding domain of CRP or a regulatory subunit of cAMP-dependent protein kinases n=1 Tax=Mucilaginibacter lappiensis TaxID=354630 RepID=A0A841JI17_9SPHI|nr:hypothetical protein [Mucilaginibacter lappiensis]MBB6130809.1 hypothetical protein [Mucilaginibacter lappiensis]